MADEREAGLRGLSPGHPSPPPTDAGGDPAASTWIGGRFGCNLPSAARPGEPRAGEERRPKPVAQGTRKGERAERPEARERLRLSAGGQNPRSGTQEALQGGRDPLSGHAYL